MKNGASVLLLLAVVLAGFYVRFDNLNYWLDHKETYFSPSDNSPLTLEIDSYYYLDIAQDAAKGIVAKLDLQRQAPHGLERPVPLPLLSAILVFISKVSGRPLDWVAILLPPFLAVLLAFPVYLLATSLFNTAPGKGNQGAFSTIAAGLFSALFALLSPAFVERSAIGWCDTDILNVAFLCALTLVALRAALASDTRTLVRHLSLFMLLTLLFLLWWDQASAPVAGFSLAYFFLAAFFSIAKKRGSVGIFALFLGILLILLASLGGASLFALPDNLLSMLRYTTSTDNLSAAFRYAGQLAAEQQDASLALMAMKIAGNPWLFALSLLGVLLLAMISRQYFLFLVPWLILLIMSIKAQRVMIFPGVLFGLGMGTIVFLACNALRRLHPLSAIPVILAAFALAWFPYREAQSYTARTPHVLPALFDMFKTMGRKLPGDCVIWSSWGHGHPLAYHTSARVIGDGMNHPPELVYSQYVPYAVADPRLAANWISFFAAHGLDGGRTANMLFTGSEDNWAAGSNALQHFLRGGVDFSRQLLLQKYSFPPQKTEEILSFLFPAPLRPVYFLLDYVTYDEQWFQWGMGSFLPPEKEFSYTMVPLYGSFQAGSVIKGKSDLGDVTIDLTQGAGTIGNSYTIRLKKVRIDGSASFFTQTYPVGEPHAALSMTLLVNQNRFITYGVLADDEVLNTVFTRMFLLKDYNNSYFKPVADNSPLAMLYEVKGDVYPGKPR